MYFIKSISQTTLIIICISLANKKAFHHYTMQKHNLFALCVQLGCKVQYLNWLIGVTKTLMPEYYAIHTCVHGVDLNQTSCYTKCTLYRAI